MACVLGVAEVARSVEGWRNLAVRVEGFCVNGLRDRMVASVQIIVHEVGLFFR